MAEELMSFEDVIRSQKETNVQLQNRKFLVHASIKGEIVSINDTELNYLAVIDDSDNEQFYKKYNMTGKKMNRSPMHTSDMTYKMFGKRIEQEHENVLNAITSNGLKYTVDSDGNLIAIIPANVMIRIKDCSSLDTFTINSNNVDIYVNAMWSDFDSKEHILEEIGWR